MKKNFILIGFLLVMNVGIAFAYQSIDITTQTMTFTGGPGFPPVDMTTNTMMFTGQ